MTIIVAPPWEEQPPSGGTADAPKDGKTYGRNDAAWAEVSACEDCGTGTTCSYWLWFC